MSNITAQPSSPAGWKGYATSDAVAGIPLKEAHPKSDEATIATYRDVYLDASTVLQKPAHRLYIYTDVLAFTEQEIVMSPPKNAVIQIFARVLTANTPVKLKLVPADGSSCAIAIYASVLDQPITVSTGDFDPVTLELGPGTGNVGVSLAVRNGKLEHEYETRYSADQHPDFQASLQTQLRIALALFWRSPSIAISICAHVAAATTHPARYPLINVQAVALGQQLAAQAMTGPNSSYFPVLVINQYMHTLQTASNAVAVFEDQYDRFKDKKQAVNDQKKAWDVMLQNAMSEKNMRTSLRDTARGKYESASKTASNCSLQFQLDSSDLDLARINFEQGLKEWQFKQTLKATYQILHAIITFAVGIGKLCLGDPTGEAAAAAEVEGAVEAVQEAEEIADQVGKLVSSDTLKKLGNCVTVVQELYSLTNSIFTAVKELESNISADIPPTDKITGSTQGDADAKVIVAIASWDKWILESDQQMEFAVSQGISGAGDYQLALRQHAINGKQLAQAQAEAVKAGQQYVQAQMEVILSTKDIENLQQLKNQYEGQEEVYEEASSKFYDRFMALKTSLVIEMRNVVWAYRYYALADSSVVLDSQKSAADYQQDLLTLQTEIENADSKYATDDQPFNRDLPSEKLPSNYHQMMLDGLKGPNHSASFTLVPDADPNDDQSFASVFTEGSHWRLDGLEATLRGAMPREEKLENGVVLVVLQITTSGVYSDIKDGKIFNFTSLPQIKRFSYDLKATGKIGETRDQAIFESKNHAEPTPFTQWTIKLLHPERVNLDGLTGVDLHWQGRVRYSATRRRK